MRLVLLLGLMTVGAALAACTSSSVNRVGKEYPARPSDWPIEVHAAGDAPLEVARLGTVHGGKPEGRLIGRLRVKESMFTTDWERSIREAKKQARKIGGDAIFIGSGGRFGAATSARSDLDVTVYRIYD